MATANDVAAYILRLRGPMPAIKLQKLLYYSHAWHLVWDEHPLFPERIEAWANGPVVKDVYRQHRGDYYVDALPKGNPDALTESEKESVRAVLDYYADKPAAWLSELTHKEQPWLDARRGLAPGQRGQNPITDESMAEYYSSLV